MKEKGTRLDGALAWLPALGLCLALPLAAGAQQTAPEAESAKRGPDEIWVLDSDKDGVPDLVEVLHRTSASDPAARPSIDLTDSDRDGVPDATEKLHGTNATNTKDFPVPALPDSDGDALPDVIEILQGRDPAVPDKPQPEANFEGSACQPGFAPAGTNSRLCVEVAANNAVRFDTAAEHCQQKEARICSYGDFYYFFVHSNQDASHNPFAAWIGDIVGDDLVLVGNAAVTSETDPDNRNFEGVRNRLDAPSGRHYWCCHDLDPNP